MALVYYSGFSVGSVAGTSKYTATVAGSAATITAGTYVPAYNLATGGGGAGIYAASQYTEFSAAVKSAFDAATASTFTVSLNALTGKYTVSRATNFTLAFSSADDLRLKYALGFTQSSYSGANTYTGEEVAKFILIPQIAGRSQVSDVYEADDIVSEAVSDGGRSYAIARRTSELLSDWTQQMETYATTFTRGVTSINAWCWQAFFGHHRGTHPFVVRDDGYASLTTQGETAHLLRADGGFFKPRRQDADLDARWHIDFRTRDLGKATS